MCYWKQQGIISPIAGTSVASLCRVSSAALGLCCAALLIRDRAEESAVAESALGLHFQPFCLPSLADTASCWLPFALSQSPAADEVSEQLSFQSWDGTGKDSFLALSCFLCSCPNSFVSLL